MIAFGVTTDHSEVTEIVHAETPAKAKAMARGGDWLYDSDWTDLKCKRLHDFDDDSIDTPTIALWDEHIQRKARSIGWHEVDGDGCCSECGLNSMSLVTESHLDENDLCGECWG